MVATSVQACPGIYVRVAGGAVSGRLGKSADRIIDRRRVIRPMRPASHCFWRVFGPSRGAAQGSAGLPREQPQRRRNA